MTEENVSRNSLSVQEFRHYFYCFILFHFCIIFIIVVIIIIIIIKADPLHPTPHQKEKKNKKRWKKERKRNWIKKKIKLFLKSVKIHTILVLFRFIIFILFFVTWSRQLVFAKMHKCFQQLFLNYLNAFLTEKLRTYFFYFFLKLSDIAMRF